MRPRTRDAAGAFELPTSRLRALVVSGMWCQFYSSVISIGESQKSAQRILCHEGSYALSNILSGERYQERMAEEKAGAR